jgi:D-tyrosyl-tRNA(Tyr) deacylase
MIALLQRVSEAYVDVERQRVAAIGPGLLVFIGVEREDSTAQVERMVQRVLGYRIFEDSRGRMNQSLVDVQGGLLLVPQFTLAADTKKGMRPSFTPAAEPRLGERLFACLVDEARRLHGRVASGVFGADMQVGLINDGPVTIWLQA